MPKGQSRGREFWLRAIDEYGRSGLSQRAYSRKRGLSVWTLKMWISRFKKERSAEAGTLDHVLVEAAALHGWLTSSQVAKAMQIPQLRAREYLRWLVEEGRLRVKGRARSTRYFPVDDQSQS